MKTISYPSSTLLRRRVFTLSLFVALAVGCTAPPANAQLGVAATFGSDTNLGAQLSYYIPFELDDIEGLSTGGDVTVYMPKTRNYGTSIYRYELTSTYFELNANAQYTLKSEEARRFYGLAGFNYAYLSVSASDNDDFTGNHAYVSGGDLGFNIGGGGEMISSFGRLFGEAKFTLGGFSQLGLLVGMRFGGP